MTIAVSAERFGGGGLGRASRSLRSMTARQDMPMPHPVYGKHRMTTRRQLHAEDLKHKERLRALDRKYAKAATEKAAEASAKFAKRWAKHVAAQNVSRSLKW